MFPRPAQALVPLLIAITAGVSACGTRGPLTLPPQPLQKAAQPAVQSALVSANTNTNPSQETP